MTARIFIYGLIFGCALYAQAPAAAPAAPAQVHLNVLALDSHNQAVGDLSAGDFEITDQGKPQTIVSFRRAEAGQPLGPHEFSNRPTGGGGATTVILFDLLNQERMTGMVASKKIGHALAQLPTGASLYFYILGLDGNLFPIHPIPEPGAPPATDDKTWIQQADAQIQTALKTVNKARKFGMTQEDFVKKTYVGLETLAKDLMAFSGTRNIVWVTDGVPQVYQEKNCTGDWFGDCALYVPHLSVRLAGADTAVYVDTYTSSPDANGARDMDYFSGSTGGRTFMNTELVDVLSQISNDSKNVYTIAYQPAADNWDKKFHKLKVTCSKGLKVQTRNRYYAIPLASTDQTAAKEAPAKDEDSAILAALENTSDVPDIGLRVTVSPAPAGKKGVHFQIHIDASDLQLHEQAGEFNGQIAVVFAHYTPKGLLGMTDPKDFTLKGNAEQLAKIMKDGIWIPMDQTVDSAVNMVRVVVYDHANNAYGSLTVPVSVADAAPATK